MLPKYNDGIYERRRNKGLKENLGHNALFEKI